MASAPVWGIDIGQCALKALRCSVADDGSIVADAFDYIEYPQFLSQPEANPYQLVREALQQFLSRNDVKHCKVAISVPGQSGLAKFIKLPPVEARKIPDIVKYEAKQQIPFDLNDVIWDYQPMIVGSATEGVCMETEVGLFAMKRDQVYRAIQPLDDADIELDVIQLAPLAVYNYAAHDVIKDLPPVEEFNPEEPPKSLAILSVGTDTSDLVVTNGFQVWQRNIPLGGNHFTKQLTKELKLTFAKAELLKRNARVADDAKAIFQAMRPVFNDLLTEVQRSLAFFQNVNRKAEIDRVLVVGNAMKLPGLVQYLEKNLGLPVTKADELHKLTGSALSSPTFTENVLSFTGCYGLCLQGLGLSKVRTNLLPREITTARIIRDKKPWAVGAAALLLLGLCLNFFFVYAKWWSVNPERAANNVSWKAAFSNADAQAQRSKTYTDTSDVKLKTLDQLHFLGTAVVGRDENRMLWLELFKALNDQLPFDEQHAGKTPDPQKSPIGKRPELHIDSLEAEYFEDLSQWFAGAVEKIYLDDRGLGQAPDAAGPAAKPGVPTVKLAPAPAAKPGAAPANATAGDGSKPTGAGWVIEIRGHHYHNLDIENQGRGYVNRTLVQRLEEGSSTLPVALPGEPATNEVFTLKELGIGFPVIIDFESPAPEKIPNPDFEGGAQAGVPGGPVEGPGPKLPPAKDKPEIPPDFPVDKYSFTLQFCWQERPLSVRLKDRLDKQLEQQKQAATQPKVATK